MSQLDVRQAMKLAQTAAGEDHNKMVIKGVLFGLIAFMGIAVFVLQAGRPPARPSYIPLTPDPIIYRSL